MMKISEMYRRSGGTNASQRCSGCCNLEIIKTGKSERYICSRYDRNTLWQKTYPACKWFNTRPEKPKADPQDDQCEGQMSFMDFPGFMPK